MFESMIKFEIKLPKALLKVQMQTIKSSKILLQTIIYLIWKFETFMRKLNLALVVRIN